MGLKRRLANYLKFLRDDEWHREKRLELMRYFPAAGATVRRRVESHQWPDGYEIEIYSATFIDNTSGYLLETSRHPKAGEAEYGFVYMRGTPGVKRYGSLEEARADLDNEKQRVIDQRLITGNNMVVSPDGNHLTFNYKLRWENTEPNDHQD